MLAKERNHRGNYMEGNREQWLKLSSVYLEHKCSFMPFTSASGKSYRCIYSNIFSVESFSFRLLSSAYNIFLFLIHLTVF